MPPDAPDGPTPGVDLRSDSPAAAAAVSAWREELDALGGPDALLAFDESAEGVLDLGGAHPSGVAAFLAGRATPLSSLFREPSAAATARRSARAVRLTATRLTDEHGLPGSHLAVGLLTWPDAGGLAVSAPVLLAPVALRPGGGDVEVELRGGVVVNPSLLRVLRTAGVDVDAGALVRLATGEHGFTPRPALERLREDTAGLARVSVADRTLVGTFVDLSAGLVRALDESAEAVAAHPVVRALAGGTPELPAPGPWPRTTRPPVAAGVVDPEPPELVPLDPGQRAAVAAVRDGADVVLHAPAGSGATQVVAHLVAAAASAGLSVLVVAPRRAELDDLGDRLVGAGLGALVEPDGPPDGAPPPSTPPALPTPSAHEADRLDAAAADAERRLLAARSAVVTEREGWGVSRLDLLRSADAAEVAAAAGPEASDGPARAADVATLVGPRRRAAAELLTEALDLGVGLPETTATPWTGADLDSGEAAVAAVAAVRRLLGETLPAAREELARVAAETGLRPAATVADGGRQLDLLVAVRDTLDVFVPAVYERPVDDMVVATATSAWREQRGRPMSVLDRRSWRRQVREVLRPGSHPDDLHAALARVAAERAAWQQDSAAGGWPRVPSGLAAADHAHRAVRADLDRLGPVLAPTADEAPDLLTMPLPALADLLRRLDSGAGVLDHLPRRVAVRAALATDGLLGVLDRLRPSGAAAAPTTDDVEAELGVLWRRAALAATAPGPSAVSPTDPGPRRAAREAARSAAAARVGALTARRPVVVLATCLAMPHRVPPDRSFDVVVLAAAHALGLAEAARAVASAPQVVVVGDPLGPRPTALSTGLTDSDDDADVPRDSLLDAAGPVLRQHVLERRHRGPRELVTTAAGLVRGEPAVRAPRWSAPSADGPDALRLELVPDGVVPAEAAADAERTPPGPEAEVSRVVALVVEHARTAPDQSLAVLAVNRGHARRVAEALRLELSDDPQLTGWFARRGPAAFVVTDLVRADAAVRDHVLLTLGLGTTPRGRVIHRFGRLDAEGGDRLLHQGLTRARRRLTVVSSLAADQLDPHRTTSPGAVALRELLGRLADRAEPVDRADAAPSDPVLARLATALADLGARAAAPSGDPSCTPDLLVAAPAGPVAVLWDGRTAGALGRVPTAADLLDEDALEAVLRGAGWRVERVTAEAVAADPAAAARAVVDGWSSGRSTSHE